MAKAIPSTNAEKAAHALARSRLYLVLSAGFRYPSTESLATMRADVKTLKGLLGGSNWAICGSDFRRSLDAVGEALARITASSFETEYLRVFTHVISSDCHPCETAYTATHVFQQTQMLADLNGFYRAFGVEPNAERADHVSVEMEFMAFLAQKEARALDASRPRRAQMMRRTQRQFLEDHLGRWVRAFARFVEKKADGGVYEALATLTLAFAEIEFNEYGADVREIKGPLKPLPLLVQEDQEEEDDECPAFATAEPRHVATPVPISGGRS